MDPLDEGDAADTEIELIFRRKLVGLRFLPRHLRSQALRTLRDWRPARPEEAAQEARCCPHWKAA
jgi:hypothetical protein